MTCATCQTEMTTAEARMDTVCDTCRMDAARESAARRRWIVTPTCDTCGKILEPTEYGECAECADANDTADFIEFMEERFDMETEAEYKLRKENRW
jgi:uncharacterized CHY-type Zn-finger protein